MAFQFANGWDSQENNNGVTEDQITQILKATAYAKEGYQGTLDRLATESNDILIEKGIHPPGPHIRIFDSRTGGTYHVNLVGTASGGATGYRVGSITQYK